MQCNVTGTVTGHLNGTTLNVSGLSTFAAASAFLSTINANDDITIATNKKINVGTANTVKLWNNGAITRLQGEGNAVISVDTPTSFGVWTGATGSALFKPATSVDLSYAGTKRFETSTIGALTVGIHSAGQFDGNVNAGVATVSTKLDLGSVSTQGIGTASPQSNLHVFNVGVSSIQVESGSAESILSLGTNVNTRQTSAEIVYGKDGLTYSDDGSLDVINYNNSHLNSIIHLGSQAGINTGSWNWIHGKSANVPKMTLTYDGKLGIGKTDAAHPLDVVGNANVSNDLTVGGNATVSSNLTVTGNITVNGSNNITIAGKNLDVTSGHSRVKNVNVTNALTVVGFSTFTGNVSVGGTFAVGKFNYTNDDGKVAITTNTFSNPDSVGVDARHTQVIARGIGVGRTTLTAAVDFSNAGRNNHDVVVPAGEVNRMYMIPPKVSNAERGNLTGVVAGALIYNTTSNKLQCHNGSGWQDCF